MDKITYNFENRTALVTGGAQGFGFDIAKRFLESGAKVIIWDIDPKMIEKAVKDLNNPDLKSNIVDVSNFKEVESSIKEIIKNFNIDINAIAPGAFNTKMLDDLIMSGPENVGEDFYNKSISQKKEGGAGFSHGVSLINFLASNKSDGISGKLISALWDKYHDWPNHIKKLKNSELYTLRRITGRDRNQNWGDK